MKRMNTFFQFFSKVNYQYPEASEQQRANGLFWMAWFTAIGASLGLLFQFTSTTPPSKALLFIANTPLGLAKVAYIILWVCSLISIAIVIPLINRGQLKRASVVQVSVLFVIAVLGYATNVLTDFFMITFTMPITAAGVMLSRRVLAIVVGMSVVTIIGFLVLYSSGIMSNLVLGKASIEDALIFGPIIFLVNGIILGAFAGGQRILFERNLALTRELQETMAKAQEASRLKSEFLANMSHELRTPLNAMLGFSGIMLQGMRGQIDDQARHMIVRIDANSKRLLSTINDILDITKIEAGRLEIVNAPFSPRNLANAWEAQMGVLAKQKGLMFKVEIASNVPEQICGDQERISQIATNLLSNAFKFTDQGNVTLVINCREENWFIEVQDSGIGIPPQALNYIFDEFRQVDGSSQRAHGGTGLGLAITRNLVRIMDGSIKVKSNLGEGSIFTVTLPLIPVNQLQVI